MSSTALKAARLFFTVVVLTALVVQLQDSISEHRSIVNFFSFFTVESNLFAIGVLFYAVFSKTGSRTNDYLRGANVTYMAIVGVVFALLLAGLQEELQTTIPWVDTVLHKVMPLVIVVDWLLDPPGHELDFTRALSWLAFPAVYVIYTLARGVIADWYPYPFLDPRVSGYDTVLFHGAGILAAMVAVIAGVIAVANVRR